MSSKQSRDSERSFRFIPSHGYLAMAVIALVTGCGPNPPAQPPATQPSGTIICAYDVRDLIVHASDISGPVIRGAISSQGPFDERAAPADVEAETPTRGERVQALVDSIRTSIAPGSWQPKGRVGHIKELHGFLIVTQTPENHKAVAALIEDQRTIRTAQVRVECVALRMPAAKDEFGQWLEKELKVRFDAQGQATWPKDAAAPDQLVDRVSEIAPEGAFTRMPRVMLFNNQRSYVTAGNAPPKSGEGRLFDGLSMDVETSVTGRTSGPGPKFGDSVTMTVKLILGRKLPDSSPPQYALAEAKTKLNLPTGSTLILRTPAMRMKPASLPATGAENVEPTDKNARPEEIVYFIIRPVVIIPREVEETSFPPR